MSVGRRREAIDTARRIYVFLKKHRSRSFSISSVSSRMRTKYKTTIKCLMFLKDVDLVKESKGSSRPMPERLFSFKR